MQTNIKQIQPSEYEMEISATAEELSPKVQEALRAQRTRTTMKGFRPGKVPMSLVKKMYGRALAYEIAERSIQETYEKEVLQSEAYDVMGQPRLTELEYEDVDGEMKAVVRFGVRPEFELQEVAGEKLTKLVHEVSDEDVENEIQRLLRKEATMVPWEEGAGAEDHAVVDLQRLDDAGGTPIIGTREEGVSFALDDQRLKEELRDALIGKKVGDTVRVELPHDHDHHHEHDHEHHSELLHLPGHEEARHTHTHRYEVTVRKLERRELPDLTSAFIEKATGGAASDEATLRELVRKNLAEAWARQSKELLHDRIVDRMLSAHDFDVPESIAEVYLDSFVEDVRKRSEGKLPPGFDEHRFREGNREEARRQAKWSLIRDRLIAEANLEVTEEDRSAYFARAAEEGGMTAEALENFYRSIPQLKDQLEQQLMSEKVFSHLESKFEIEEKDPAELQAEAEQRAE